MGRCETCGWVSNEIHTQNGCIRHLRVLMEDLEAQLKRHEAKAAPADCSHENGFRGSKAIWYESCSDCGHSREIVTPAPQSICDCTTGLQCRDRYSEPNPYCTRPLGHSGAHVACAVHINPKKHNIAKWESPPPTAPPFVLGPRVQDRLETVAIHSVTQSEATCNVARETARLIAEWLRKSTDWLDHDRANKITRGDWGIE